MSKSRFFRPILALVLTALIAVWIASADRAQPLEPANTAPAPEFQDDTVWLNSDPLTMAKLRGKVVLIHFWTNGCSNCMKNYPHYKAWQERYQHKDVVIVGIHTPETSGERDVEGIKAQAAKHGLKFPIAIDNEWSNWKAWQNHSWPTVYVVDKRGQVRFGLAGELDYKGAAGEQKVRKLVDALLLERP